MYSVLRIGPNLIITSALDSMLSSPKLKVKDVLSLQISPYEYNLMFTWMSDKDTLSREMVQASFKEHVLGQISVANRP